MDLSSVIRTRDVLWDALIIATAAAVLLVNLFGLLNGIAIVIPHLLYIPVVIAAYRYPRYGGVIAVGIGAAYLLMIVIVGGSVAALVGEAFVRACVLVVIGTLVGWLSFRLREQESLYRGLFEHSESGSLLVRNTGTGWTIEAANWRAAELLHRKNGELNGAPLTGIWDRVKEEEFFGRLSRDGAVYAAETTFTLPDEKSFTVLLSAAALPGKRAILTFVDITDRVRAEEALKIANDKLNLLSRISADHIHYSVDQILDVADAADAQYQDAGIRGHIDRIRTLAWTIARRLFLSESYKNLGTSPPVWIGVQRAFASARPVPDAGAVSVRIWAERLEVYADPLFSDVLVHLLENSLRHGGTVKNIVVTYHETGDGLDIMLTDDGTGIPIEKKERIFEYDSGGQAGLGLFICRQIVEVTGMTIRETGAPGRGARFIIHVPPERYRIEGTGDDAPQLPVPPAPGRYTVRHATGVTVKELLSAEFPLADALWIDYHKTTGDPRTDRIFAAFLDGQAVSVARCRRHADGHEVDGVFTPVDRRGHGYANAAVWGLVEACGCDVLYMHSVRNLDRFYGNYGFVPIDEKELPPTIRERYAWAQGEMEGSNVLPMKREPEKG
ncbi:MAG: sensor protein KdpD [Methanoregula sp. PtaU1.Bin051]|nr:MAG: sensor protein KdpD [Methanoregula sp. PtaU1.Bin051]